MSEQTQGQSVARGLAAAMLRWRVEAVDGGRVPFARLKLCPACGCHRAAAHTEYCESAHVIGVAAAGERRFENMQTTGAGAARDPHLHISCGACGFEWLEEPAWTAA